MLAWKRNGTEGPFPWWSARRGTARPRYAALKELLRVAVDQLDPTAPAQGGQHIRIQRVDRAVEHATGLSDVVGVFLTLDSHPRVREEVRAVRVIPVDVRDHHVRHVLRRDAERRERPRRHRDEPSRTSRRRQRVGPEAAPHAQRGSATPVTVPEARSIVITFSRAK